MAKRLQLSVASNVVECQPPSAIPGDDDRHERSRFYELHVFEPTFDPFFSCPVAHELRAGTGR